MPAWAETALWILAIIAAASIVLSVLVAVGLIVWMVVTTAPGEYRAERKTKR